MTVKQESLKNLRTPSSEEARKMQKKGAAAKSQRAKIRKSFAGEILRMLNIKDEEGITKQTAIIEALCLQAIKGNIKAVEFIRDTIGEKPIEQSKISFKFDSKEIEEIIKDVANEETSD